MPGDILLARDGAIATVTVSNAERMNAIGLPMWEKLGDIMLALDADEAVRCVVLRGAGEKAFGAGADISEFATTRANATLARKYGARTERAMLAISGCRHPTVAMIHGACVGGGLLVASRCDIRIAGESARFGVPVKRGQISAARVIVEATMPDAPSSLSHGTHFFHRLLSNHVLYMSVEADGHGQIDWDWLDTQEAIWESRHVRHVRLEGPLDVRIDCASRRGLIRRTPVDRG